MNALKKPLRVSELAVNPTPMSGGCYDGGRSTQNAQSNRIANLGHQAQFSRIWI